MTLTKLLEIISQEPQNVSFDDVISTINENYQYTATTFRNGDVVNESGTNEGSCKIFAFAQINKLSLKQTLACFGKYYRDDVLANPSGKDHGNIRNFMVSGWEGVSFSGEALIQK